MQTFLPYPSFQRSARCLDRLRLGKQRVEALQILSTLRGTSSGWVNHPAVRMWRGAETLLAVYAMAMIQEWTARGYKNNMVLPEIPDLAKFEEPAWLGDENFHASHRSNLLRKDPKHYGQFGWTEPTDLPYIWPEGLR